MKKILLLLCVGIMIANTLPAQNATENKKVAVYVTGSIGEAGVNKVIGAKLVSEITKQNGYIAIERTSDFLRELQKEQQYQQSGEVDDNQISKLGKQFGVDYVCVADVTEVFGSYFISARLIDVETAGVEKTADGNGDFKNDLQKLVEIAQQLAADLFGNLNGKSYSNSTSQQSGQNKTFTVGGVTFEMVYVEGGSFMMGCTGEQSGCSDDEKPVHRVTISSFYMGAFEVTQALWQAVMGDNPSNFKGDNNCPVENVSWNDCQDFVRELNRVTGAQFRLPTEAEWEYAARGGRKTTSAVYAGSNGVNNIAWYDGNSGSRTHPVGTKLPNELGIYDMSGNVWEWCSDWYSSSYGSASQTDPSGAYSGSNRVARGGSWRNNASHCRVADRGADAPGSRYNNLGFRLAFVQ